MQQYKNIYFIGIGGIGMSAIARYFHHIGKNVSGYDKTSTKLTTELEKEGISIHYNAQINAIPSSIEDTLVVYTPAIPSDFEELCFVQEQGYTLVKRAKVLGLLANSGNCIAIAGTHGKTSVTTMTAHILKNSSQDCGAFLGGIAQNYNSNFLLPEVNKNNVVVEADEFDRSFLNLTPNYAVITSMDADHLDIYNNHANLEDTFCEFANQIRNKGTLIYKKGLSVCEHIQDTDVKVYSYDVDETTNADFFATNLRIENGYYRFDLVTPTETIYNILLTYPGLINVENAVAASAIAILNGVTHDELKKALESYKGVRRRFDIQFKSEDTIYIDDYAHHPTELDATISSVRQLYPNQKISGIFQPHLFSRTKDFQDNFAKSLEKLDNIILLDIYPARELPIPGITSEIILEKMNNKKKIILSKSEAIDTLSSLTGVIMTLGAGDIDTLIEPIRNKLNNRY